jgi:chemotaxis protein CheZ
MHDSARRARAATRGDRDAQERRDLDTDEMRLLGAVADLGRTIATTKSEIAALRVDDITLGQIPLATDELDAIVAHTAAATERILESCETLDQVATELGGPAAAVAAGAGEAAARLREATTRIYEACGFQDITGQRINKIVAALKVIEAKVARIVATFGERGRSPGRDGCAAPADIADPASLLNGPQPPASAMDQTDIDKLLATFE